MVRTLTLLFLGALMAAGLPAQVDPSDEEVPREKPFLRIVDVPSPEGVVLEVGGLCRVGEESFLVCTRRGELWRIDGIRSERPRFRRVFDGLQEPLGLLMESDGSVDLVQRGELTRLIDRDGDGVFDRSQTLCNAWDLSGSYHEYAFGPRRDRAGNLWLTLNRSFDEEPFGSVDWRGWAIRVTPDGKFEPVAAGLRSPAGIEVSPDGDVFYTDNQGEWCGANKLAHIEVGDFHGHPFGKESCKLPQSRVAYPGEIPDGIPMPNAARRIPGFKLPAIWFPYDKMGQSPSGMVWDTQGNFGPFRGQLFVGDQHHASVMRCDLEKIGGHFQGACFPFRSGLASGVIRLAWGPGGELLAGLSNRGWGSKGRKEWGLQRLIWEGKVPFEIQHMRVRPNGFRLVFTRPVNVVRAAFPGTYEIESYTYELHAAYGSPEIERQKVEVKTVAISGDGRVVDLGLSPMRTGGYVYELHLRSLVGAEGEPLVHNRAYYTLVNLPEK
ncbi:MAG TPA: hypothetical protein ENK43_04955 [Planctomycetes bacterium]|nr:hypothetical protein [Planctomycetota bacterium]